MKNVSPWVYEIENERKINTVQSDQNFDCIVIGGGISGISTAQKILEQTNKSVCVVEAYKIAHGATGHNAGQLTSYFERPLSSIAKEYGDKITEYSIRAVEEALYDVVSTKNTYNLTCQLSYFDGCTGLSSKKHLDYFIKERKVRIRLGLNPYKILLTKEYVVSNGYGLEEYSWISYVSKHEIQKLLKTNDEQYKGVVIEQKGVMNSALYTDQLTRALLKVFKTKFFVYEQSPVQKVIIKKDMLRVIIGEYTLSCNNVILCTNGFENITFSSNIFCQSEEEQTNFLKEAHKLGAIIQETSSGPLFKIALDTIAGKLQLLKIRKPDPDRPERGDADFTISNYPSFKEKYLNKDGFSLVQKDNFEMIELYEKDNNVRVYFPFPPLDKQLGLK